MLLLCSVTLSLGLCELALRTFYAGQVWSISNAASLGYRYDHTLGWFPVPNSRTQVTASRTITATHNSQGFRAPEPDRSRPGVLFLGDSMVWGFDVEVAERFTEKLQARRPEWSVYNCGVCGYGTDQEYLLLQRLFDKYRPRVVFLVVNLNDNEDNALNFNDGSYKPYYTLDQGGSLKLNGVPVPKSSEIFLAEHKLLSHSVFLRLIVRAYHRLADPAHVRNPNPPSVVLLREMQKHVSGKGASFVVGLSFPHAGLEQVLRNAGIRCVDVSATDPGQVYPGFGEHWTPEGHSLVAQKIDDFFRSTQIAQ